MTPTNNGSFSVHIQFVVPSEHLLCVCSFEFKVDSFLFKLCVVYVH